MPAELTLAIEVSNPSSGGAGIAVGSRSVLGVEPVRPGDGRQDDLAAAIDRLAKRVGFGPQDLKRVAVSVGPGGYTSLRIAVATAKMICEATGAQCVAIPTVNVAAARVSAARPFAVALASKDDSAYAAAFASPGERTGPGRLINPAAIAGLGVKTLVADQFLPHSIAEAVRTAGIALAPLILDPAACLELSFGAPATDPVSFLPIYPREPEAVTKWRTRKGG